MKKIMLAAALMLSLGVASGSAEAQSRPGGCLKYGLGGAVAGHFAGGHRIKGALAGCALGIYQRRKYEREVRERNENRNRNPERRRSPGQEQANRYQNPDRSADRGRAPEQGRPGRYDDLGLDPDRGRTQNSSRNRDGYESGGSFARGQTTGRDRLDNRERSADPRWPRSYGPGETGSLPRPNGTVY
jgi:hypothetical protein